MPHLFQDFPQPYPGLLPTEEAHTFQASVFLLVLWSWTLSSSSVLLPHGHYQTMSHLPYLVDLSQLFLIPDLYR